MKLNKILQNNKITKQTLLIAGLVLLVSVGGYLWWDKKQFEQCERLMTNRGLEIIESISKLDTSREKVIGKKVYFCIKKLYGMDPSEVQFTRPFPK